MMSETVTHSAAGHARSSYSSKAKARLVDELARQASEIPTSELRRLMPGWRRAHISHLRNRRVDEFGWERLFYAAERLGVPLYLSIGEPA